MKLIKTNKTHRVSTLYVKQKDAIIIFTQHLRKIFLG